MKTLPPATLPWWRSRVIVGALVSVLCKLLFAFGITSEIAEEDERQLADAALLTMGIVGDAVAIRARLVQEHAPPITSGGPNA